MGLWLNAPEQTLAERLQRRQHDASDADAVVLRLQLKQDAGAIAWHTLDASPSTDVVLQRAQALLHPHVNDAADRILSGHN